MNKRTIQIDVIGKIEGTQFMKCKLYTGENIVIIMMNEFDYERLKEEGIFIRDGKSRDSAGVLNTTNTFIEKKLILKTKVEMNKKIFCEKCHRWHTITITEEDKFAICPNKRCGHLIFIIQI